MLLNHSQEDKPVNHLVFKFDIIDNDDEASGNGRPFTFEIRNGNENNEFRMTQDGHLRTATKFNHMVKADYHLLIRVYDNGRPPLFAETWIDVKVSVTCSVNVFSLFLCLIDMHSLMARGITVKLILKFPSADH